MTGCSFYKKHFSYYLRFPFFVIIRLWMSTRVREQWSLKTTDLQKILLFWKMHSFIYNKVSVGYKGAQFLIKTEIYFTVRRKKVCGRTPTPFILTRERTLWTTLAYYLNHVSCGYFCLEETIFVSSWDILFPLTFPPTVCQIFVWQVPGVRQLLLGIVWSSLCWKHKLLLQVSQDQSTTQEPVSEKKWWVMFYCDYGVQYACLVPGSDGGWVGASGKKVVINK